jgi:sugar phosphate isomerase/epimerase
MLCDVLLQETDPAHMHFEMDLYWVVRAGQDPLKWFSKFPGRFSMVHVKDMDKQKPQLNTEVGKGSVNFKQIFSKAKLAGIKNYIVEQENFEIDPYKSITESSKYLQNVLLA